MIPMSDLDTRARAAAADMDRIGEGQDPSGADNVLSSFAISTQIANYGMSRLQDAANRGTAPSTIEGVNAFLEQEQLDLALKINQYDDKSKGYNISIGRASDGKLEFKFKSARDK